MAETPKKKKPPASSTPAPQGPAVNTAPDVTGNPDAYDYALQAPAQPADGGTAQPQPDHPVKSWWGRFNDVMSKKRSSEDLGNAMARGVVGAVNSTAQTVFEGGASIARNTGIGEAMTPGYNAAYDEGGASKLVGDAGLVSQPTVEHYLGKRSDDGVAQFAETATQFATSFAALGELRYGAEALKVSEMGHVAGLVRGAVSDMTAFDPYEAQLAELAARSPVPGLKQLGQVLSVGQDDGPVVARLKRAAAGVVTAATMEGLIGTARIVKAKKVIADEGATAAQKAAAQETIATESKVVQDVADGVHKSPDDPFVVEKSPDGWKVALNPDNEAVNKLDLLKNMQDTGFATAPLTPDAVVLPANGAGRNGTTTAAVARAKELVGADKLREMADAELAKRGGAKTPEASMAAMEQVARNVASGADVPRELHFPDRGEAEATAASAGESVNQRYIASKAQYAKDVPGFLDRVSELVKSNDEDGLHALMQDSDHFNVSYFTEPKEALAAIQTTSEQFKAAIDAAQSRGGATVEELLGKAGRVIGALDDVSAAKFIHGKLAQQQGQAVYNLVGDWYLRHLGKKVADLAVRYEARGADHVLLKDAAQAIGNLMETQRLLAGANSEWGRTGRLMQERGNVAMEGFKLRGAKDALNDVAQATGESTDAILQSADDLAKRVAGMDKRTIDNYMRAVRIADGEPRNLYAIAYAARKAEHTGAADKFMEFFANGLLSRPVTALTQLASGLSVSALEPAARLLAGIATGNGQLAREATDMLFAHAAYFRDNIESMVAALKAGKSIVNPQTQHTAWSGVVGDFVRAPQRVIIGMDEFTKVANYRAQVRAKSLRLGREAGLTGTALDQYVARDLSAAFDDATGIAMVPDALKFGETAAMSAPLEGAFGRKYQELMETSMLARVITPFVKAPINLFNYAWTMTPGLNRFNSQARAIMQAGGEPAAVLHARSTIAGTLYGYGAIQALQGNLTGRGPTDPKLRKEWLQDHQPYSIKVGNQWISYKRTDPIGMPLGIIADGVNFASEMSHEHAPALQDFVVAGLAATTSALSSRSYLQGLTQFAQAWGQGDTHSAQSWINNFVGNIAVPGAVDVANPDTTMREVQTMGDAIMSRVPGWSQKLDPKFNIFGEPVLRAGATQRAFNPFLFRNVSHSTEEQLLEIGQGFPTPPRQEMGGKIDLGDHKYDTNKIGKSPYARWMELVAQSGLRNEVTKLVRSPEFKSMSNGTDDYKGGEQYRRVMGLIERHTSSARREMLREYPTLALDIRRVRREKGAAIRGGEEGVATVDAAFSQSQ